MTDADRDPSRPVLLAATFAIAAAGLTYELIAGAVSSYLLGDSITQFSLVIGFFLTAMGIGAWLSRFVEALERTFVATQIALGLVGGFSAAILFFAYAVIGNYWPILLLVCLVAGALVGLEIPLITRILQRRGPLSINLANVLALDYVGALAAALAFPLVLAPQLGLIAAGLLMGLLNLLVAGLAIVFFRRLIGVALSGALVVAIALTGTAFVLSDRLVGMVEARLYDDEIVLTRDTPYQRVVITRQGERYRLFLNGGLQFDTIDEYRYHEALVHPAMIAAPRRSAVLILGGGDGMAAREVLRYADVEAVMLVDLDPDVTGLFQDHPDLVRLNGGALSDPRVSIVNRDAWAFLRDGDQLYDVVIIDLPDPHALSLSKLYSREFYAALTARLPADGVIVTQATSPLFAREAFWSIHRTLDDTAHPYVVGDTLTTRPYHVYVPSFGEWGFVLAGPRLVRTGQLADLPDGLRFLTAATLAQMTVFPSDMASLDVEANSIIDHPLTRYYLDGWSRWFQ